METQPENINQQQNGYNPIQQNPQQNVQVNNQKSGSKKYIYILLIVAALGIIIVTSLYIITNKSPIKLVKEYTSSEGEGKSDIVSDVKKEEQAIIIKDLEFDPATLEAKTGEPVIWINEDKVDHTIKLPTGNPKTIKPGGVLLRIFKQKGTYEYECTIHPEMTGTIEVN